MAMDVTLRGAKDRKFSTGADTTEHTGAGKPSAASWRPWSERDDGIKGQKKAIAQNAPIKRAKELFPKSIVREDVATIERASATLAKLLACPELEQVATEVGARANPAERARLERTLASFALLADSALTMLDYDRMSTGWDGWSDYGFKYPSSRTQYRERRYRYDLDAASKPRQERSRAELLESIGRALDAGAPAEALEAALIESFFSELGVAKDLRADWKPNAEAIGKALEQEALIPLRALYAAAAHLDHRGVPIKPHTERELNEACRSLMETVIRHVAEGDFGEWRFTHDASRAQLASLTPAQLDAYRANVSVERETHKGRKLTTRDARDFDLLWVTKIGGPSHGFDMLSQCLFPLLANARNGAIIVDDAEHQGAARSTLRLLPASNGEPVLFLEMLQIDYPYERMPVRPEELRDAIVAHALEKARAIGVPLAIAPSKWESAEAIAKRLGEKGARMGLELVLEPSGGVFESSDTLLGAHHRPQMQREVVKVPDKVPRFSVNSPLPFVIQ